MASKQQQTLQDLLDQEKRLAEKCSRISDDEDAMKKRTINQLHIYNEIKDAAQTVIGAVANIRGDTIKKIHKELNLPSD